MYHSESECRLCTTSFPSMKEVGSRVAWLTFSCFCAKSYISEGPVRHVGLQLCYPAKKCRKKKPCKLLHCLGRSHGGIPAGLAVTQAESRLRKSLSFRDTLQFLNQTAGTACRLCIFRQWPTLGSASVWSILVLVCLDTSTHSCNMLTCPSNLKRLYFIFASVNTGRLPRLSKANLIRSPSKDTHPWQKIHIPWEQT